MTKSKEKSTVTLHSPSADLVAALGATAAKLLVVEQQRIAGRLKQTAERRMIRRQRARLLTWLREQLRQSVS